MKIKSYHKSSTFSRKKTFRIIGALFAGCGILVLLYFFFPIVSMKLFINQALANGGSNLDAPLPQHVIAKEDSVAGLFAAGIDSLTNNYEDARNWYPGVESSVKKQNISSYLLSIPKLKIKDAVVSTVNYDLNKNLVQYYGTSTPPNNGTTVIYGHSTLPQLFDPKNYKAIFATLHTIQVGDEIVITVNDVSYTYTIFSKTITSPSDTTIFSQNYDNSYVTLVTCTPPGTSWKRLIIRAKLDKLS